MMAASSSDSWRGNAGTKRVFQPFEFVDRVKVNVGSFNLGLHQSQIQAKNFQTSTLKNFRRIIAKGFEEGELHLLNLCEVGGHKQGLRDCCIEAHSVLEGALKNPNEYGAQAVQAYMSIWHNTGDSHPGGTSLTKQDVRVKSLESSSVACDPQASSPDPSGTIGAISRSFQLIRHVGAVALSG